MNGMASGKILRRQRTHLDERPWRYSPRRQRTDNRGPRGLYWPSPTSAARRGGGNSAKIIVKLPAISGSSASVVKHAQTLNRMSSRHSRMKVNRSF